MPDLPKLELRNYREIVVMTGAGVSVASGLPTYRGAGGVWNVVDVEHHATATAIEADPNRVWEFFGQLRAKVAAALPNAELEVFPWGGHAFTVTAADAFNSRLLAFLSGHA